jgi:hypothetical protein
MDLIAVVSPLIEELLYIPILMQIRAFVNKTWNKFWHNLINLDPIEKKRNDFGTLKSEQSLCSLFGRDGPCGSSIICELNHISFIIKLLPSPKRYLILC